MAGSTATGDFKRWAVKVKLANHTCQLTWTFALNLDLVILAAGLSTRYRAPKALEPVGPAGERLTDYAIYDAVRAGFSRIVFVIRKEHEAAFRDHQVSALQRDLAVVYVFQGVPDSPGGMSGQTGRTKPWGTGHALLCAASLVKRPFAMINADDFYGRAAFEHLARHLRAAAAKQPPRFAMVSYPLCATLSGVGGVSRAICSVDSTSQLQHLREYHELQMVDGAIVGRSAESGERRTFSGDEPVSMNIWGFTPEVFPILSAAFDCFWKDSGSIAATEFLIGAAVQQMVESGAACVKVLPGGIGWLGITYPGDRNRVGYALADMVQDGQYPSPLMAI